MNDKWKTIKRLKTKRGFSRFLTIYGIGSIVSGVFTMSMINHFSKTFDLGSKSLDSVPPILIGSAATIVGVALCRKYTNKIKELENGKAPIKNERVSKEFVNKNQASIKPKTEAQLRKPQVTTKTASVRPTMVVNVNDKDQSKFTTRGEGMVQRTKVRHR